jgi:branched-chain amino acid transport system permease protein
MDLILGNAISWLFQPITAAYALAAIGIALHFGFTGLLNFGQAVFMAVGAYGFSISVKFFGLGFWPAVGVAVIASIAMAFLLGIPTLRLRSDYLAIVTIAAAEVFRFIVSTTSAQPVTGGPQGLNQYSDGFYAMNPIPVGHYKFWVWDFNQDDLFAIAVSWVVVVFFAILLAILIRSPWGRVIKGIREDEDAVRSLGKNVYSYKMQSLAVGGLMGTFAGILFVLPTSVQPGNYGTTLTFYIWTILLLGGASTVIGSIVGAMIFWSLLSLTGDLLSTGVDNGTITFLTQNQVGAIRFILVGVALMLLVIFRPQGIFGNKKELYFNA